MEQSLFSKLILPTFVPPFARSDHYHFFEFQVSRRYCQAKYNLARVGEEANFSFGTGNIQFQVQ